MRSPEEVEKEKRKICPMMTRNMNTNEWSYCIEDDCQWWINTTNNPNCGDCAIGWIASALIEKVY